MDAHYCATPEPYGPEGIRLSPWMSDGKALAGPGMKDARSREPAVGKCRDRFPGGLVALATAP